MSERFILMWFDTEDYITPEADDAALFMAEEFSRNGLVGTFKIVGEKARMMESRGRRDVIDALAKHSIGFHTRYHSKPPTVPVYLEEMTDWDASVAEFKKREGPGLEDVSRVFGKDIECYGQAGTGWAPQSYAALAAWGIPMHLDGNSYLRMDGRPFWYQNILGVEKMATFSYFGWGTADPSRRALKNLDSAMELVKDGGVISLGGHPCEIIAAEWWDVANFPDGVDKEPSAYKSAAMLPPEQIAIHKTAFAKVMRHVAKLDSVRSVGPAEVARAYRDDTVAKEFTGSQVREVAGAVAEEVTFVPAGRAYLSAAQALHLMCDFVAKDAQATARAASPLGPRQRGRTTLSEAKLEASALVETAKNVLHIVDTTGHLPHEAAVGPGVLSMGDLAATLAAWIAGGLQGGAEVRKGILAFEKHVEGLGNGGDWPVLPPGFAAPNLEEFTRLQAWTLKPAVQAS